jgi:site-specific DNA-methyltransferase (adenine-specific)
MESGASWAGNYQQNGLTMDSERFLNDRVALYAGDCLSVLAQLPENSIDSCVTDPPYGLEFMGKEWDSPWQVSASSSLFGKRQTKMPGWGTTRNPTCDECGGRLRGAKSCTCKIPAWDESPTNTRLRQMTEFQGWCQSWAAEIYRVLKPGAHLLAFGGTRTYHRMACAIEDAGFEIRDCVQWIYGQGFPKSRDISKDIDRAAGAEREIVGFHERENLRKNRAGLRNMERDDPCPIQKIALTAPATDAARQWEGWGTALKPATEIICVARKPLGERTVAANVLKWGTGALNIDGCRVGDGGQLKWASPRGMGSEHSFADDAWTQAQGRPYAEATASQVGRWPANVIHDGSEEVVGAFPDARSSGGGGNSNGSRGGVGQIWGAAGIGYDSSAEQYGDAGSAARFFYAVKQDCLCGLCNLPYNAPCDANNAANDSSIRSIQTGAFARNDVLGLQRETSAGNGHQSSKGATSAANDLSQCHPPKVDIVQENAPDSVLTKIVQSVKSAASLCNLCATDIARALVAVRHNQIGESIQFKDFIGGRNAPILIHHLALYVEGRESTDTILTTPNLKQLFGSVFYAIENCTLANGDIPKASNGKSERFWYGSKADQDDRLGSKHPTIKPLDLMQFLVRLVTPRGGTCLDLFAGTGTTGEAAWREGMSAVLIEREAEYCADIRRRMALALASMDERRRAGVKQAPDYGPLFGGSDA